MVYICSDNSVLFLIAFGKSFLNSLTCAAAYRATYKIAAFEFLMCSIIFSALFKGLAAIVNNSDKSL